MTVPDDPKLPAAQVTPPLPDPDDDSPTIQISGDTRPTSGAPTSGAPSSGSPTSGAPTSGAATPAPPRWSGSATVPPPGTPRRRNRDDDDTYDLPVDVDYGPTLRERFRVWRAGRRRPAMVHEPAAAPPQPPLPGPPPGWYPPPGYAPPGHPGYPAHPTYPGHPTRTGQFPTGQHPAYRTQQRRPASQPPGRPPASQPPGRPPAASRRPPVNPHPYPPPPAPPRRRRRRWPWWMLFWLLMTVACCGGITLWGRPFVDEYPASIASGADVPGLTVAKDTGRQRTADQLLGLVESEQIDEQSVSVLYTDQRQRGATLLATTRFVFDPEKDLTQRFADLTGQLKITGDAAVDAGDLGGYKRCGAGTLNGRTVAVCGWADHGSLAVAVFGGRSVQDAAQLLDAIRSAVLKRG